MVGVMTAYADLSMSERVADHRAVMLEYKVNRLIGEANGAPDADVLAWLGGEKLLTPAQWEFKSEGKGPESLSDKAKRFAAAMRTAIAWWTAACEKWEPAPPRSELETRMDLIARAAGGVEIPWKTKAGRWDSFCARMTCPHWWARQLYKVQRRRRERAAVRAGQVRRGKQLYCTDDAVKERRLSQATAQEYAQQLYLFNDDAEVMTLAEVAERSLANPAVRSAEMFVRLRGMEEFAQDAGHAAVFVTITCPSRMHASSDKYDGTTPRQAQHYLCEQWAKARAALGRETKKRTAIDVYGMRIAEPHHDGCPHWHALFFLPRYQLQDFKSVMRKYAWQVDGGEPGAFKRRIVFEDIDSSKGSAVGYIAKYIAKNIDGKKRDGTSIGDAIDSDMDGADVVDCDAVDSCERVLAWASLWGIRQFQQIGGACIGPWRELRRIHSVIDASEILEQARSAADAGDFCAYLEACQAARIATEKSWEYCNRYGEPVPHVVGVKSADETIVTRRGDWVLMRLAAIYDAYESADGDGWAALLGEVVQRISQKRVGFSGGAKAPPLDLCH